MSSLNLYKMKVLDILMVFYNFKISKHLCTKVIIKQSEEILFWSDP